MSYTLDPAGNRLTRSSTLAVLQSQSLSYDANDRLASDTFDDNGNTVVSNGVSLTYDFEDRLVGNSTGVGIVYDGDGNRPVKMPLEAISGNSPAAIMVPMGGSLACEER